MDIFSHALWGRHLTYRRLDWRVAAMMSILPDLLAFIPSGFVQFMSGEGRVKVDETTQTSDMPAIAWDIYQITHSFIWTFLMFLALWAFFDWRMKQQGGETLAAGRWLQCEMKPRDAAVLLTTPWVFHILIDIPSHTLRFFPTPFLMPLSDFMVDGVMWSTWWVWGLNALGLAIVWWLLKKQDNQRTAAMASMAPRA